MTDTEQIDRHAALTNITGPLRRIIAARVVDPHLVDDVVQETLSRLLDASDRVGEEALLPYAVVTARNLVATRARNEATAQRHAPRLVSRDGPEGPEEVLLRKEEADALRRALLRLPDRDRQTLIDHEFHDVDTNALAVSRSSTPGAVAAQLARTRARMRVEYLLALRGVELPTASCRPVLLSLSAGDQRRQRALDAGSHLLACSTCAALSQPLLARKRGYAGILPAGVLAVLSNLRQLGSGARSTKQVVTAAAAAGAMVVVVASGVMVSNAHPDPAQPVSQADASSPRSTVVVGARQPRAPRSALAAAASTSQPVIARMASVVAVPADEGFWISNDGQRLWVQLTGSGESTFRIQAGQRLSFAARVARHEKGFARRMGVSDQEGARELDRQRFHLQIAPSDVRRS